MELELSVESHEGGPVWLECDVKTPASLSLAPDRDLQTGRTRLGIASPNKPCLKKIKLFSTPGLMPGDHTVSLVLFAFGPDAVIAERVEQTASILAAEEPRPVAPPAAGSP